LKALKISLLVLILLILAALGILMGVAMKAQDRFVDEYLAEVRDMEANKTILSYPEELLKTGKPASMPGLKWPKMTRSDLESA